MQRLAHMQLPTLLPTKLFILKSGQSSLKAINSHFWPFCSVSSISLSDVNQMVFVSDDLTFTIERYF